MAKNDSNRLKVLVTGGSGFVGSHVADALTAEGYEVIVFDLSPAAGHTVRKGDLGSLGDVKAAVDDVDYICHLGGVGDVYLAMEKPFVAASSNVLGTTNLMEAARQSGVKKVVYASTWEVYGKPHYQPMDEDHPCAPEHFYSITKLAGEQIVLAYDRLKGIPTVALRLGTAYGTRMRSNSVFAIFIERALRGEPIIIRGDGSQSRQFVHTGDVARGFILALASDLRGMSLNLAPDESVSVRQLAETVCGHLPTEIRYDEERVGEVPTAQVTSEKIKRLLGWKAEVNFQLAMKDLISYYRSLNGKELGFSK